MWLYVQSRVRGAHSTMSLRPMKVPTGSLCLIRQDDGQVDIPYAPCREHGLQPPCEAAPCGCRSSMDRR